MLISLTQPYISYIRLMRLHSPTGALLLMCPSLWSLVLATGNIPSLKLLVVFIIGSFLMRGAGCIINDIIDRNLDKHVTRTKARPLANGDLSVKQACQLLLLLLTISLGLLLTTNKMTIIIGVMSIIPIVVYPYMKRITFWPQVFLGFTFNIGALMGWTAVKGKIELPAILLYIAGIFWTIGYDTIYAHQDKEDDQLMGIKSTALILGDKTTQWVKFFYQAMAICLLSAAAISKINFNFYLAVLIPFANLYWQTTTIKLNDPDDCFSKFKSNSFCGIMILISLLIGVIVEKY